jgi:hypothetical protein
MTNDPNIVNVKSSIGDIRVDRVADGKYNVYFSGELCHSWVTAEKAIQALAKYLQGTFPNAKK